MTEEIDKNYKEGSSEYNILTRILISNHDFSQAFSAATFLLEEVNEAKKYEIADLRKFRCYETSLIISYARPFSQSRGRVKPLRFEDIGVNLSKNELTTHQKIIWLRNKLYGHSDADFVDFESMIIDIPLETDIERKELILPLFRENMRLTMTEVAETRDLAAKLIQNVVRVSQKMGLKFKDRLFDLSE